MDELKPAEVLSLEQSFSDFIKRLPADTRFALAYSGGLDSSVLLHLLHSSSVTHDRFYAVHIHHGLAETADEWRAHCLKQCQEYAVECRVASIRLGSWRRVGLEARARELRYQAIFELLQQPKDILLTAHHQRDQVETFFLKLLRGAGVKGLAAMREQVELPVAEQVTMRLLRPLLKTPYPSLQAYAAHYCLNWVEDPSNQSLSFERNRVRHRLLPQLADFNSHAFRQVEKACSHLDEADQLLQRMAERSLLDKGHHFLYFDFTDYANTDWIELKNILQFWLKSVHSITLADRHYRWLEEARCASLSTAKSEYQLPQAKLAFYHQRLYCLSLSPKAYSVSFGAFFHQTENHHCDDGAALSASSCKQKHWYFNLNADVDKNGLLAHAKIEPLGSFDKKLFKNNRLKNLFQSESIPVWERDYWPVLSLNGMPVVVLGCQECVRKNDSAAPLSGQFSVSKIGPVTQDDYWRWMGLIKTGSHKRKAGVLPHFQSGTE
ncbi:tRNA lysidine(34) synthetase TilS [Thiomicrorhabdus sp.]|uniref:tRNA lysidine(34) synthetase TilS n=1 Tax=Thiomicrorhabdus sp. TaxID=2039724 RepID=UPI0029C8569D|nr:tRNA lysidine(34) synthetase TilS [Thiomicrorhabdus sp.]